MAVSKAIFYSPFLPLAVGACNRARRPLPPTLPGANLHVYSNEQINIAGRDTATAQSYSRAFQ